jgi:hypothetical protein
MDTQLLDTCVSLKILTMNILCMEQYKAGLFYMHILYVVCLIQYQFFVEKITLTCIKCVLFYKYNKGMLI